MISLIDLETQCPCCVLQTAGMYSKTLYPFLKKEISSWRWMFKGTGEWKKYASNYFMILSHWFQTTLTEDLHKMLHRRQNGLSDCQNLQPDRSWQFTGLSADVLMEPAVVKCLEISGWLVGVDGLMRVIGWGYLEILPSCFHWILAPRQMAKAWTSWSKSAPEDKWQ